MTSRDITRELELCDETQTNETDNTTSPPSPIADTTTTSGCFGFGNADHHSIQNGVVSHHDDARASVSGNDVS